MDKALRQTIRVLNFGSSKKIRLLIILLTSALITSCTAPQRTGYNRNTSSYKPASYRSADAKTQKKPSKKPSRKPKLPKKPRKPKAPQSGQLESMIKPWLGTPYKYGGSSKSGTDCSGFVMQIMKQYKGISLPHSTKEAWKFGKSISKSSLQKGDVLFFGNFWGVSHNAIYIGDGRFAHASTSRGVRYDQLNDEYWAPKYKGAKRY